ncbi:hypothetical protein PsYK624_053330 [Phanerochaete sordida]|uniref:Uncharacterized protein n=1 Tax=Phanerochaete sordida TaxID=48140 RepID=A0A9P3G717_9APHY|nr:hypothetical protein PsYK624_053330 [Phanerochaete sordida]
MGWTRKVQFERRVTSRCLTAAIPRLKIADNLTLCKDVRHGKPTARAPAAVHSSVPRRLTKVLTVTQSASNFI